MRKSLQCVHFDLHKYKLLVSIASQLWLNFIWSFCARVNKSEIIIGDGKKGGFIVVIWTATRASICSKGTKQCRFWRAKYIFDRPFSQHWHRRSITFYRNGSRSDPRSWYPNARFKDSTFTWTTWTILIIYSKTSTIGCETYRHFHELVVFFSFRPKILLIHSCE